MKKKFKILKILIITAVIVMGVGCSLAADCSLSSTALLWDMELIQLIDEDAGVIMRKAEYGDTAYGSFTTEDGEVLEAKFVVERYGEIYAYDVEKPYTYSNYSFACIAEFDEEEGILSCKVTDVAKGLSLGFEELTLKLYDLDESEVKPYEVSSTYSSADGVAWLSTDYDYVRVSYFKTYKLSAEGYIERKAYCVGWGEGEFKIFEIVGYEPVFEMEVASGTYDFGYKKGELTLTFENDNLYGENKPFEGYPVLRLCA